LSGPDKLQAVGAVSGAAGGRGAFCFMGVCQECAIHVDGAIRQACLTPVRAGLRVELRGVP